MLDKKILEEIIYNSPLVLLKLDKETIDLANEYLPYSTGFELECEQKPIYNQETFKAIPNIINDSYQDYSEQRYRIPNGVNGLICLYNICYHLGENSLMNEGSGIHYHVDCTDTNSTKLKDSLDDDFSMNILKELDEWDYKGTYNSRGISLSSKHYGYWIKFNDLQTLEFRLGNMSFDYKVLVKQIIHANDIVRRWKNRIPNYNNNIVFDDINRKLQIDYQKNIGLFTASYSYKINKLLDSLKSSVVLTEDIPLMDDIKASVSSRVNKLY